MGPDRVRFAVVVLLVAALAGCGGADESTRPTLPERLAALCEDARTDIEALGLPSERGVEIVRPWAARGARLADDVGRLDVATPRERAQIRSLARSLREYYDGLRLGYDVYTRTRSLEAYAAAVDRAKAFLAEADELAAALGAPECAVRPFHED
jgi:hypothetical protein